MTFEKLYDYFVETLTCTDTDTSIENDSIGYTEAWGVPHIDRQPDYLSGGATLKFALDEEHFDGIDIPAFLAYAHEGIEDDDAVASVLEQAIAEHENFGGRLNVDFADSFEYDPKSKEATLEVSFTGELSEW